MLKSGENNNRAANPPGYLLSDIKRRSLSSLLDRIPRKKEPCYSCLSGRAQLLGEMLEEMLVGVNAQ